MKFGQSLSLVLFSALLLYSPSSLAWPEDVIDANPSRSVDLGGAQPTPASNICSATFSNASAKSRSPRPSRVITGLYLGALGLGAGLVGWQGYGLAVEAFAPQDHVTDQIDLDPALGVDRPWIPSDLRGKSKEIAGIVDQIKQASSPEVARSNPEEQALPEIRRLTFELIQKLESHVDGGLVLTENEAHQILNAVIYVLNSNLALNPASGEGEILRAVSLKKIILTKLGHVAAALYENESFENRMLYERAKEILMYALPAVRQDNGRLGESYQIRVSGFAEWHRRSDDERIRKEVEYEDFFGLPHLKDGISTEATRLAALESLSYLIRVGALSSGEVDAVQNLASEMTKALRRHHENGHNLHLRSQHSKLVQKTRMARGAESVSARNWMDQDIWLQRRWENAARIKDLIDTAIESRSDLNID